MITFNCICGYTKEVSEDDFENNITCPKCGEVSMLIGSAENFEMKNDDDIKKEKLSTIEQVEDAFMKMAPTTGGILGGFVGAGFLSKTIPVFFAFAIGGAVGGGMAYIMLSAFFHILNPKRDRSK